MRKFVNFCLFSFLIMSINGVACRAGVDASLPFLTDFGKDSQNVLNFLGSPINPNYFSSSLIPVYEQANDYALSLLVADLINRSDEPIDKIFINLANPGPGVRTICISAVFDKEKFKNFIIRLKPGEWTTIDATEYIEASRFIFVCINNFYASLTAFSGRGEFSLGGDAELPLGSADIPGESLFGYCHNFEGPMWVEHYAAPEEPELAYFKRFVTDNLDCPYTGQMGIAYYNTDGYQMDVYYPNSNILHHRHAGAWPYCTACYRNICPPKCLSNGYSTKGVKEGGPKLWWRRVDYFETDASGTENSFDDVFFYDDCGKAFCGDNLTGICAQSNDWLWYVYVEGNRPKCFSRD